MFKPLKFEKNPNQKRILDSSATVMDWTYLDLYRIHRDTIV